MRTAATHRPLVGVAPHAGAGLFDVLGAEEGQGRLCRDELDLDVLMLSVQQSVEIAGTMSAVQSEVRVGVEQTNAEKGCDDEGRLDGCDAAGGDEDDVGAAGGALVLGDERRLRRHDGKRA
jgi:hypothetical protein